MTLNFIMSYHDELIEWLQNINNNVNWEIVMKDYANLPIDKLLNKLKVYVWSDKSLNENMSYDPVKRHTYLYYMKWIYKLFDKLTDEKCGVVIMDEPRKEENRLINDLMRDKVKMKVGVLKRVLTLMGFKFEIVNDEVKPDLSTYQTVYCFPTCSIIYSSPSKFINENWTLVDDGYYNIHTSNQELEFNMFRLLVVELVNNPALEVQELLKNKYGMIKTNRLLILS